MCNNQYPCRLALINRKTINQPGFGPCHCAATATNRSSGGQQSAPAWGTFILWCLRLKGPTLCPSLMPAPIHAKRLPTCSIKPCHLEGQPFQTKRTHQSHAKAWPSWFQVLGHCKGEELPTAVALFGK